MDIFPPQKIKIAYIEGRGRGVVATQDIKMGETIEVCPILFISKTEEKFMEEKSDILKFYYLEETANDNRPCLMLGYGSLYNHDTDNPNADIDYNEGKFEDFLFYKAIKDIKAGEEILFNYEFEDNKIEFLKQ